MRVIFLKLSPNNFPLFFLFNFLELVFPTAAVTVTYFFISCGTCSLIQHRGKKIIYMFTLFSNNFHICAYHHCLHFPLGWEFFFLFFPFLHVKIYCELCSRTLRDIFTRKILAVHFGRAPIMKNEETKKKKKFVNSAKVLTHSSASKH